MFHEVDEALRSLVRAEVLGDAQIEIAFDPPNRPWIGAVQGPTINFFLYDVREDTARRDVMLEPVLDETGKIIGRRAPAHRYDLYYLASVWAPTVALEHQILAALTAGLAAYEVVPAEHTTGALRESGNALLATAGGMKRGMPGNFGGELKFQLELVVTVALPAKIDLPRAGRARDRRQRHWRRRMGGNRDGRRGLRRRRSRRRRGLRHGGRVVGMSEQPTDKTEEDRTDNRADNEESALDKVGDAVNSAKHTVVNLGSAFKRGVSDARDDL